MERIRTRSPMYTRQKSISSTNSGASSAATPSSPVMSPMHHHVRSGSAGGVGVFRRQQNTAARAAAQRLARVMAQRDDDLSDDDDEDDDLNLLPPVVAASELSTPRRAPRSPSPRLGRYLAEQTSTVRSTSAGRPSIAAKQTTLIPPIRSSSRALAATLASEPPSIGSRREKRMSVDLGILNMRETGNARSSSALQDEIDVLQEENENVLEKLRLAEERFGEAEAKARQLEKQVAHFGDGVLSEGHVLNRKEAAQQQRGAAVRAAAQSSDCSNREIAALRREAKIARDAASSTAEHLHEAELEIKSLREIALRMTLTQEEMEEVVLKRCWLARYWKLCVRYGIHADIAEKKCECWASLAPHPLEVVLSAGQKASDGCSADKEDIEEKDKVPWDIHDLAGEGSIESMLLVEKGLRELASLKVEDAIMLAMAQHRRAKIKPGQSFSGSLIPAEGPNPIEAFELSEDESEDVLFKQAWLAYFWRRVRDHGLEEDIADDRLQFWINQRSHSPTSQDAVEVERGLFEFKKLGIESLLWEVSHRWIDGNEAESY